MRRDFWIFVLWSVLVFVVWHNALLNFFAQDDFILISHFSQNNLWQDIKNVFGPPQATHWRPIHNLYFLVAGNIFGKNYIGYHLLTLAFHIGISFFIYKTLQKLTKNSKAAISAAFIYAVHPAHFVSLLWISGGATVIGFLFLITSFYYYLIDKKIVFLILYVISLLASEAMVVGLAIFTAYEFLFKKEKIDKLFLIITGIISAIFLIIRFVFLTSKVAIDVYQLELSAKVFNAIKYYLLRIAGFAEVSGDRVISIALLGWLALIALLLIKNLKKSQDVNLLIFSVFTIIVGLFPFILIPEHLSPHYMNISIFGFSMFLGLTLKKLKPIISTFLLIIFLVISIYNINLTMRSNWVVKRSNLANTYLEKIKREKPVSRSILIFRDNELSTSQEAYISLGTGDAIKFFFASQNYETCFSKFDQCLLEEPNAYVVGN